MAVYTAYPTTHRDFCENLLFKSLYIIIFMYRQVPTMSWDFNFVKKKSVFFIDLYCIDRYTNIKNI